MKEVRECPVGEVMRGWEMTEEKEILCGKMKHLKQPWQSG